MAQILIFTSSGIMKPHGAYQVAHRLRSNGYSVLVIHYFQQIVKTNFEKIFEIIDQYVDKETLWVGFSSTFLTTESDPVTYVEGFYKHITRLEISKIAEYIKEKNPKCSLILGGARSYESDVWDPIDYFVKGYADNSIIELTKFLEKKNPFFQIKISEKKNKIISHDTTASSFDFANTSFEWHSTDMIDCGETLPIEISRGCIFRCSYCSYPLNGKRKLDFIKSPNILKNELIRNYEMFGTTKYVYGDDTHNDSVEKLEMLYNEVYSKLPFKINFACYLRLDLLKAHPHTIDLLRESGLKSCFFGIESMNYEANKTVGKGIKEEAIVNTLQLFKEKCPDVFTQAGFIVGLPNDSKEKISGWLDLISENDFPLDCVSVFPLGIDKNQTEFWPSDFDINYQKYGYKFLNETIWENNVGLDLLAAIDISKKYDKTKLGQDWMAGFTYQSKPYLSKQDFNVSFLDRKNILNENIKAYLGKLLQIK
jgi:radical SAM superfamily enzyme YgiQ (UPF0313 family)